MERFDRFAGAAEKSKLDSNCVLCSPVGDYHVKKYRFR